MILHCVFCNVQDGGHQEITEVMQELAEFSRGLEGVHRFDYGPNRDFEAKSQDHDCGFVIAFDTAAALQHYADHPTHKALGARLCNLCNGGAAGIVVYDIEA